MSSQSSEWKKLPNNLTRRGLKINTITTHHNPNLLKSAAAQEGFANQRCDDGAHLLTIGAEIIDITKGLGTELKT